MISSINRSSLVLHRSKRRLQCAHYPSIINILSNPPLLSTLGCEGIQDEDKSSTVHLSKFRILRPVSLVNIGERNVNILSPSSNRGNQIYSSSSFLMPEHQRRYLSSHVISSNIFINNNHVSALLTESIIRRFSEVSNEASTKRGDKNEVVANSIKSSIVESETDKSMGEKVTATVKYVMSLLLKTPGILWFYLRNPAELKQKIAEIKHLTYVRPVKYSSVQWEDHH